MRYLLYGLRAETDRPLPGLAPEPWEGAPDLRIWLGSVPAGVFGPSSPERPWLLADRAPAPGEDPTLRAWRAADGTAYRLAYADGVEVRVDAAGGRVACTWPPSLTLEDAATYLLGPACGFVLRLRGVTALHASAVALGGAAIALCGPAGAGKSTTAAAFAARGRPVLSDDVVPLLDSGEGILARPAYPHLRLWPDAVRALRGEGADLPPLTPTWDKRFLDLAAEGAFHALPLPLAGVYVLGGREDGPGAPRLERVPPGAAVLDLVANVYMGWLPDAAARGRDLALLGRVAASVPVSVATAHADPARLEALCAMIEADAASHRGAGAAHG
ncbi:MAG TPA: hypothetical protein VHG91_01435 [Longimicrobium sp.]|nr:hypothetical protein [Longimicrobium sp.]